MATIGAMPPVMQPLHHDLTPSDHLLACSDHLAAAFYRADPKRPEFGDAGPFSGWYIVFPRNHTEIRFSSRQRLIGNPAQLMLYNPGDAFDRRVVSHDGDHSDYIFLDEHALRGMVPDAPRLHFTRRSLPLAPALADHQRRLFRAFATASDDDVPRLREQLLMLAAEVCQLSGIGQPDEAQSRPPGHRMRERIEAAKEILIRDLIEPPSVEEVARRVHTSPFHLIRQFRRHTGYGLHEFVTQQRLRLAYDRLADGAANIATVAADLGFSHQSHFTKQFRRAYGEAPGRFMAKAAQVSRSR